ncbi:sigma-70 family RNA polymerase sigma factor [Niallia sp.]|uniref:RNA polymerase sigma factor n=1 Tax=Niallia sp. TaxID=2837523 RepID=UPI002897F0C5|nr:sigma-70 family RNA polymerase sigma factor [Niallia sp.]
MEQQTEKETAFLKLFQQYEHDIYRMAYVYVKNKDDALDIVQETAYKSFQKFSSVKDVTLFKTWIIKIAINCSIDLLRKNKKLVYLQVEGTIESSISMKEDIPLSISLQDLLDILNEEEKTVVLLKFYQGYTFNEISDFLDMPLSTVKSMLYRALEKLRKKVRRADMYG